MTNEQLVMTLESHWHKIAALIMHKAGLSHVHITMEDLRAMDELAPNDMPAVVAHDRADGLHIRLMSLRQAEAYQILHEKGDLDGPREAQKV
jgi:hypothetical protein